MRIRPTLVNRRTYSKCNILCDYPPGELTNVTGQTRPRQNSVFTGSSFGFTPSGQMRRTKSALDLQSVILTGKNLDSEQDILKSLRPANESTKLLQRDQSRRTSVCQFDKMKFRDRGMSACQFDRPNFRDRGMSICHLDTSPRPCRRDRGMSICQFDRMDVLARPLQRERGMSICQFDRMDVLARPLQRDRIGSAYHFDRTEVRPNLSMGKSLLRERRVSACNFLEKDEEMREIRERRSSFGNFDKIDDVDKTEKAEQEEIFSDKGKRDYYQQDPCCSKNSDIVFGYKATRV
ncbi:uncharacterized protein LOC108624138 isoform X1 [Ceratina calcarata]|uniref:Uncharacterized protein LOC108624138 isoform X1 n=1 Tax=Ceratina calcarata TaxID=156304 RepID=A0AAJ7WA02_9HYME|nr:uncharacterized protein LOC108624138 isoform X1 [Ceratina calcarata]